MQLYRAGALVFGGGHVILPLLRAEIVPRLDDLENKFLAMAMGAVQAVPGPLFTFSGYLGTMIYSSWPLPPGSAESCVW